MHTVGSESSLSYDHLRKQGSFHACRRLSLCSLLIIVHKESLKIYHLALKDIEERYLQAMRKVEFWLITVKKIRRDMCIR